MIRRLFFAVFTFAVCSALALIFVEPKEIVSGYNKIRPMVVRGGGQKCLDELANRGIEFTKLSEMKDGICLVKDAVKINSFPNTSLSGPIILNCNTAIVTHDWLEVINAKSVMHYGTYNCRTMRGSGVMSEHSFGTAIDIAAINGSSVQCHWNALSELGSYIRNAADLACDYFSNAITPEHNTLHYDHLHLDMGYGTTCMPKLIQELENKFVKILAKLQ